MRLGLCLEKPSYTATYKDAVAVLARHDPSRDWLMQAYMVLREHGRSLCKRAQPICLPCPLDGVCAHAVTGQL